MTCCVAVVDGDRHLAEEVERQEAFDPVEAGYGQVEHAHRQSAPAVAADVERVELHQVLEVVERRVLHKFSLLGYYATMTTAAILGCAGYTGQETLDRLLAHPGLEPIAP